MTVFKQSLKKSILQIVFKIFITVLVGSAILILDYSKGFVWRTPDHIDQKGTRRPISIVVDIVK